MKITDNIMGVKPKFNVGDKVKVKQGFSNLFSDEEQLVNEYKEAEKKEHIIKDVLPVEKIDGGFRSMYFAYVLGTGRILFKEDWLS